MARLGMAPMEPAALVMERKMLLGIKDRAERLAADEQAYAVDVICRWIETDLAPR